MDETNKTDVDIDDDDLISIPSGFTFAFSDETFEGATFFIFKSPLWCHRTMLIKLGTNDLTPKTN